MTPQLIKEKLAIGTAEDQWMAIMAILDQAAEAEIGFICGSGVTPEERTHSAGRLDALLSTKKLLEDEKENSIKTL
tara:strand:+ start:626 stop:853 length:228 start_codon:yes stop_codon:yes gene_type:complete